MGVMGAMRIMGIMGVMGIMRMMRVMGVMRVMGGGMGTAQAVSRERCRAKPGHNCIGYIIQLHWLYNNVGCFAVKCVDS